jgi:flagellar basal-body rod modification protein FlgD
VINSVGGGLGAAPVAMSGATPGGQLGKEEFLKMLVAQLRNQDPLNPMQGDQMAVQLAQFSSVEQLMNIGKAIEGQSAYMLAMAEGLNSTAALGVIGKSVTALGDGVYVGEGGRASVRATVGGQGGTATLKLLDRQGNVVGEKSLGDVKPGNGSWEIDELTQGLEAGWYRFEIEVTDAAGQKVPTQSFMSGIIDGIQFTATGPVLKVGPFAVPYGTITEIVSNR